MAVSSSVLVNLEANVARFTVDMAKAERSLHGVRGAIDSLQKSMSLIKFAAMINLAQQAAGEMRRVFEFAEMGAKVLQVEKSFDTIAKSAGIMGDALVREMDRAAQGTVDNSDIMQKALRGIAQGLSESQLVGLMKAATTASKTMGMDVSEAYGLILDSVTALRTRGLKQAFPMILDQEEAFAKLAKTMGVNKDELSEYGKMQAIANAIMEENTRLAKTMGEQLDITVGSIQRAKAELKNFTETIAKGFLAVLMGAVGVIQNFNAAFWLVASSFLAVAEVILRVGSKLPDWAGGGQYKNWADSIKNMRDEAEKTAFSLNEQGNALLKGSWGIVTGGASKAAGNVPALPKQSLIQPKPGKVDKDLENALEKNREAMGRYYEEQEDLWFQIAKIESEQQLKNLELEKQTNEERIKSFATYIEEKENLLWEIARVEADQQLEILRRQNEAYDETIKSTLDYEDEIKKSRGEYLASEDKALRDKIDADAKALEESMKPIKDMATSFISTWDNVFANMMDKTKKWSDVFRESLRSMLASFIHTINAMIVKYLVLAAIKAIAAPATGGLSMGIPMAEGGVVTRPTNIMAGESGPEAIIPLKNGSVPVQSTGKQSGGNTYVFISSPDAEGVQRLFERNSGAMVQVIQDNLDNRGSLVNSIRGVL